MTDKEEKNQTAQTVVEEKEAPVQTEEKAEEAKAEKATEEKPADDAKATSSKFEGKKKKIRRQVLRGRAYVKSTYNNTVVTLTDMHGNVLAWSTAGLLGFKGAKKATTYAASQIVNDVYDKVQKYGLKELDVYVQGVGAGRESAVRTLIQKGFNINMIKDTTPIPHNGCRPKKPRRV